MNNKVIGNEKDIIFYNDEEGNTKIEVLLQNEDVWLNTEALAELFSIDRSGIVRHINNIYKDNELNENSTCAKIAHMGNDGKQSYNTKYYNLDMIISIGFRVNSKKAIEFRTWANKIIKDYMIQGFALNDDRFMKARKSDQEYFNRLLDRIKLIRTSERMFYQKITDIYATSVDYDKKSPTTIKFFKKVQNKMHYAVSHQTAAEIIYNRADSEKEHMGLNTWKNSPNGKILETDVVIAKNYLNTKELESLELIVSAFLDLAENRAKRHIPMTMEDWATRIDKFLLADDLDVLNDAGKISHEIACDKALTEFEKYRVKQDKLYKSDFDLLIEQVNSTKK